MTQTMLPTAHELAQLTGGLINRPVEARIDPSTALDSSYGQCFVGTYDDGKGQLEALWLSDLPVSASFGAALTLLSKNLAEEGVKAKAIHGDMLDNLREVVNVVASAFKEKRVRLVGFYPPGGKILENVAHFLKSDPRQLKLKVEVKGYLPGSLTLLVKSDGA